VLELRVNFNEQEEEHRVFGPQELPILIGRDEEAQIRIDNVIVSRRHAAIGAVAGRFVIVDLESENGFGINGSDRVTCAVLSSGDRIEMGKYTIIVGIELLKGLQDSERRRPPLGGQQIEATMAVDKRSMKGMTAGERARCSLEMQKPHVRTTPLLATHTWLGRAGVCDIILKGFGIAPRQALLYREDDTMRICDLTMKGKVKVNGKGVDDVPLSRGDRITIGKAEFEYRE
jgi:pSer/pThr/pTyr-binding forkhead associated (FHA) protein